MFHASALSGLMPQQRSNSSRAGFGCAAHQQETAERDQRLLAVWVEFKNLMVGLFGGGAFARGAQAFGEAQDRLVPVGQAGATSRIRRRARSRSPARSSAIARLSRVDRVGVARAKRLRRGASASWKRPSASRSRATGSGRMSTVIAHALDGQQQAWDVAAGFLPDDRAIHAQQTETGGTDGFVDIMFGMGVATLPLQGPVSVTWHVPSWSGSMRSTENTNQPPGSSRW